MLECNCCVGSGVKGLFCLVKFGVFCSSPCGQCDRAPSGQGLCTPSTGCWCCSPSLARVRGLGALAVQMLQVWCWPAGAAPLPAGPRCANRNPAHFSKGLSVATSPVLTLTFSSFHKILPFRAGSGAGFRVFPAVCPMAQVGQHPCSAGTASTGLDQGTGRVCGRWHLPQSHPSGTVNASRCPQATARARRTS